MFEPENIPAPEAWRAMRSPALTETDCPVMEPPVGPVLLPDAVKAVALLALLTYNVTVITPPPPSPGGTALELM